MKTLYQHRFFRNKIKKNKKAWIISIGLLLMIMCITQINIYAQSAEERIEKFQFPKKTPDKVVYVTFDDGPSIYSSEIMDVLEQYNVSGIFFVIGENFEVIPNGKETVKEMVERGHYVGLHSMTHNMDKLYFSGNAPENFVNEMKELKSMVYDVTGGFETNLCRAPYGSRRYFKKGHYEAVEREGLVCVDWNVDSLDWSSVSADQIYENVLADYKRSQYPEVVVLLFHEKKQTVKVLPKVIEYYKSLGYEFISYSPDERIEMNRKSK